jgi:hypothetical protein
VDYLCMEVCLEKEEELRINLCCWNSKRVRVKGELKQGSKRTGALDSRQSNHCCKVLIF